MPTTSPAIDLDELDRLGYTVVKGLLPPATTASIRAHMDQLLPPMASSGTTTHGLRHPIPGRIMADLLADTHCLQLAKNLARCPLEQLRLNEQVLIRTDRAPPGKAGPHGWHLDWAFLREQYDATPRETYFHMVTMLSTVQLGGAAFTIVPGSHHLTFAAADKIWAGRGGKAALDVWDGGELSQDTGPLAALKADPIGVAGIDVSTAIEVTASEGDCVVFNPMCLHSGSFNSRPESRYVYFQSFHAANARYLRRGLAPYQQNYDWTELRAQLPPPLHSLLLTEPPPPPPPASQPPVPAAPVPSLLSTASPSALLSPAELAHFKEWGFVIKRGYRVSVAQKFA